MRMHVLPYAVSLLVLLAPFACESRPQPSLEAAKAIQIVRHADPRTLVMRGGVSVAVCVPQGSRDHAEDYAYDALKMQALREHPGTTILFDVKLAPGSDSYSYIASGIAAESRGDS